MSDRGMNYKEMEEFWKGVREDHQCRMDDATKGGYQFIEDRRYLPDLINSYYMEDAEYVDWILERFDVNAQCMVKGMEGLTFLHLNALFGNWEVVLYLLKKGADLSILAMSGESIFFDSVLSNCPITMGLLIEHGADPHAYTIVDGKMQSSLMRALLHTRQKAAVFLLIELKCSVDDVDHSVFERVVKYRQLDALRALLSRGVFFSVENVESVDVRNILNKFASSLTLVQRTLIVIRSKKVCVPQWVPPVLLEWEC